MVRTTSKYNPELEAIGSEIVKRLGGVWKPGGAMCRCPAHADRSPSLSVRVGDHALLFKCFASCDSREDRKSVVQGKGVAVSVDLGGRRIMKKKKTVNQKN